MTEHKTYALIFLFPASICLGSMILLEEHFHIFLLLFLISLLLSVLSYFDVFSGRANEKWSPTLQSRIDNSSVGQRIGNVKVIGKFQDFKYPNHAERFSLSDYTIKVAKDSNFIVDNTWEEYLVCPSCKAENPAPNHGDAYKCNCGLKYQSYGNALYIWK